MAVITKQYTFVSGTLAIASNVNRNFDDLYTLQNGNINSANLAGAIIGSAEIVDGSVDTAELADCAVTSIKIGNSQVQGSNVADGVFTFRSLDYDLVLFSNYILS